jgi:hypothetical protein
MAKWNNAGIADTNIGEAFNEMAGDLSGGT